MFAFLSCLYFSNVPCLWNYFLYNNFGKDLRYSHKLNPFLSLPFPLFLFFPLSFHSMATRSSPKLVLAPPLLLLENSDYVWLDQLIPSPPPKGIPLTRTWLPRRYETTTFQINPTCYSGMSYLVSVRPSVPLSVCLSLNPSTRLFVPQSINLQSWTKLLGQPT